jgi:hypothetical protein
MFSGHVPHGFDLSYSIQDIPWERVNVARFQIDFDRSNSYTAARPPSSLWGDPWLCVHLPRGGIAFLAAPVRPPSGLF